MYDRKSTNTNKTVILGRLTCLGHKTPDYFPDVLQRLGAFCLNLRRKFVPGLNGGSPKCNTIHYSDDSGKDGGSRWDHMGAFFRNPAHRYVCFVDQCCFLYAVRSSRVRLRFDSG